MDRVPNPLIDELAGDLAPVRPLRLAQGALLVVVATLATIVLVAVIDGLRHGAWAGQASSFFFIANGMLLLLGTAAAFAVLRMASPRVGNSRDGARWSLAMVAVLPATAIATALLGGHVGQITGDPYGPDCFMQASAFSVLIAAALVLWLRHGAPVSLGAAGLFTGIAASALGTFAFGLACPFDSMMHLGTWHMLPVALGAVVGRYAVPPLVRW